MDAFQLVLIAWCSVTLSVLGLVWKGVSYIYSGPLAWIVVGVTTISLGIMTVAAWYGEHIGAGKRFS